MIKSIRLQNFFGFQDCTINLEKGENVLVGINGSGKSNFFKAIRFLFEMIMSGSVKDLIIDAWGGRENIIFVENKDKTFNITYFFDVNSFPEFNATESKEENILELEIKCRFVGAGDYKPSLLLSKYTNGEKIEIYKQEGKTGIVLWDNGKKASDNYDVPEDMDFYLPDLSNNDEPQILDTFCSLIRTYAYFDTSENGKIRLASTPRTTFRLNQTGDNLTRLLHTFKLNNKKVFREIVSALKKVNANFSDIDFNLFSSNIELLIEETGFNKSIPISNISDGTIRFLCLMSILYNPKRGTVICIDEPELGLHPDMIRTLAEAVEYAAKTSQIIISTHNPDLLNHFSVENIRVFEKNENNATIVSQYDVDQFDEFMNKYMTGQLWRQGHLGGNRW